jgi:hypothetical protein
VLDRPGKFPGLGRRRITKPVSGGSRATEDQAQETSGVELSVKRSFEILTDVTPESLLREAVALTSGKAAQD